jgi:hypothetical protein
MKTIIIPFNGSTNCHDLTETIVSVSGNENLHCIFLFISPVPDNYNDLFSLRKSPFTSQTASTVFYNFAQDCKAKYGDRVFVVADHIYSDSPAVFRNYAQFKNADMVVFDAEQWDFSEKKERTGVFRMLSRCGCALLYVAANRTFIKAANSSSDSLWEKETVVQTEKMPQHKMQPETQTLPETLVYQYSAVDEMLNEWENNVVNTHIFSTTLGNMARYFLKETTMQKMLLKSRCSFVLLKKAV